MRVIKILLYLFLLFMVYIWLSTFFKSCNNDNVITSAVDTIEETTDDLVSDGEEILDEADDLFESDSEDEEDDIILEEEEINYEELDAEEDLEDQDIYEEEEDVFEDLVPTPTVEEKPDPKPTTRKPNTISSGTGNYFVITGSYLLKSNASEMKGKLERLGHDAEILNFDDSEYHAVTAGRYASYEDATVISRRLSGKGIDNYVHRRK